MKALGWSGLFCVLLMGLALAEEKPAVEPPPILPDDPLYAGKREQENQALAADLPPLEEASLHTRYAQERLAEVKAMVSKGKSEFVPELLKDYAQALQAALARIDDAQAQGGEVSKALEVVEEATRKHTQVLRNLLDKVPEEARAAVSHALEVSRHGQTRAGEVLEKIKRGELPVRKPLRVGEPEKEEREERGRPAVVPAGEGRGRLRGIPEPARPAPPEGIGRPEGGRPRGRGPLKD